MKTSYTKSKNRLSMRLREHLNDITVLLARQEEQLRYHIKRTDLLEESVDLLRKDFIPVKKHVELVNSLCKIFTILVGIAGGISGAAYTITKIFSELSEYPIS